MIPYGRQSISSTDIDAVVEALQGDFLTTGPLVEKFEKSISILSDAPSVAVSSGTAALHCAYAAIGVEPGDEIITPPITFIATQATAALFGASIRFADVDKFTGLMDPTEVESKISKKTKAIVAVDYAGQVCEMEQLRKIADKYGVYLIEDAAHSLGSTYFGQNVGSIADITTFSFFPTKNATTGEGGAISSHDPELLDKARKFARQGLVRNKESFRIQSEGIWHQEVHRFGLNYRLPDVLCALGISQFARLHEFKAKRQTIFDRYVSAFESESSVQTIKVLPNRSTHWHLFPIFVEKNQRMRVFNGLRESGIMVQVNYLPAYRHPVFKNSDDIRGEFPNSEQFYESEISLPMYSDLSSRDQDVVIEKVLNLVRV